MRQGKSLALKKLFICSHLWRQQGIPIADSWKSFQTHQPLSRSQLSIVTWSPAQYNSWHSSLPPGNCLHCQFRRRWCGSEPWSQGLSSPWRWSGIASSSFAWIHSCSILIEWANDGKSSHPWIPESARTLVAHYRAGLAEKDQKSEVGLW